MQTTEHKATGTSTGKIILMGEHAVVYGEPAVAIPFPATSIETTISQSDGPVKLECIFHNGLLAEAPEKLNSLVTAIKKTLKELNQEMKDFDIKIESTVPPERGMGSSAAVAVATIRSLYHYFDAPLSDEKLLELTNASEVIAHGNPSGLDAAMTSGKQPLFFVKGQSFTPFSLNLKGYLVVADTGIQGNTKEAVDSIAKLRKKAFEQTDAAIVRLGTYAKKAKVAIETNDAVKLGECMNLAHKALTFLGVSNEVLDTLVQTAVKAGALGAKLTGGGRGGCMIALAADKDTAKTISSALSAAGAVGTWEYQIGDE